MRIGALAQLGERYDGIVEVNGSIPLRSTIRNQRKKAPLGSSGAFFVLAYFPSATMGSHTALACPGAWTMVWVAGL